MIRAIVTHPHLCICLFLALLCLAMFWQTLEFEFVNYDDNKLLAENPVVRAGLTPMGAMWALWGKPVKVWSLTYPLTWMSHMLDAQLWGIEPMGHHLTSVLLHIATVMLLFVVLLRSTGFVWRSAFIAALLAIHPLNVETVSWIAARKDLTSGVLWMLTILAYMKHSRQPGSNTFLWVVGLFTLGVLAKPMLATLSLILLLLDYWPLDRFSVLKHKFESGRLAAIALVKEKIPLFVISVAGAVAVLASQRMGGTIPEESIPFTWRAADAVASYTTYLHKMLWPTQLAVFYQHPANTLPVWRVVFSVIFVVAVSVLVWRARARRPYLMVGWGWYVISLAPSSGIVQIGSHCVADHYAYLPLLGIFIMIAWGVADLLRASTRRRPLAGTMVLSALALAVLGMLTGYAYTQVPHWEDSATLFARAVEVTPGNSMPQISLGAALMDQGNVERAAEHFRIALRLRPHSPEVMNNLGNALAQQGETSEAVKLYRKAIALAPEYPDPHSSLGIILIEQKKLDEAIVHLSRALKSNPAHPQAGPGLVMALCLKAQYPQAWKQVHESEKHRVSMPPDMMEFLSANMPDPGR